MKFYKLLICIFFIFIINCRKNSANNNNPEQNISVNNKLIKADNPADNAQNVQKNTEEEQINPFNNTIVFFWVGNDVILPLGCVNQFSNKIEESKNCFNLVSSRNIVRFESGIEGIIEGQGEEICEASGNERGFLIEDYANKKQGSQWAVFPSANKTKVIKINNDPVTKQKSTQIPDDELRLIAGEIAENIKIKTLPLPLFVVRQSFTIDFDGDNNEEKFYSVEVSKNHHTEVHLFSGIIMKKRLAEGEKLFILLKSDLYLFTVIYALDLDKNGTVEFVIDGQYYEGESTGLYRFDNYKLISVGLWGCGA